MPKMKVVWRAHAGETKQHAAQFEASRYAVCGVPVNKVQLTRAQRRKLEKCGRCVRIVK